MVAGGVQAGTVWVPVIHLFWSGCVPVLAEGPAEPVSSADIEMREPAGIGNRFGERA